jgi:hypothetical protein
MSIEVEGYDNFSGERRVRVCIDRARVCVLSVDEASALRDQLDAALSDPVESEVDDMFPETCTALFHGPRHAMCTCEEHQGEE